MELTENILKSIATMVNSNNQPTHKKIIVDNIAYIIDTYTTDNRLALSIEQCDEQPLRDFINDLDDDIFQKACDNVYPLTAISLNDWNENYSPNEILEMFKTVVLYTVNELREKLKSELENLDLIIKPLLNEKQGTNI